MNDAYFHVICISTGASLVITDAVALNSHTVSVSCYVIMVSTACSVATAVLTSCTV